MSCCPIIDGGGSGPTPPPVVTCANTVLVQSLADFPAPTGTEIQLAADTLYRICGAVDIGALTLRLAPSTVVAGEDPVVDSLRCTINDAAVLLPEGGTVRDLSIAQIFPVRPRQGSAIQIAEPGGATVGAAVVFNVAARGEEAAIKIAGRAEMISIARLTSMGSFAAVLFEGTPADPAQVLQVSIDQVVAANPGAQLVGIEIVDGTGIQSLSFSLSVVNASTNADFGIRTAALGLIETLRVSSCAYFGPGQPSQIAQGGALPFATTGTARNSEAVGCVGFTNSRTRAGAQIVAAPTPSPAPVGTLVPIGVPAGPTYTLSPGASRFELDGATGPTQSLRYIGFSPADVNVTGYVSVQVAAGFGFTTRVILAQIWIDRNDGAGFVPVGPAFAGATPQFSPAPPTSIAVSEGVTLEENFRIQLRIANATDLDPLLVVAARIVVGEE